MGYRAQDRKGDKRFEVLKVADPPLELIEPKCDRSRQQKGHDRGEDAVSHGPWGVGLTAGLRRVNLDNARGWRVLGNFVSLELRVEIGAGLRRGDRVSTCQRAQLFPDPDLFSREGSPSVCTRQLSERVGKRVGNTRCLSSGSALPGYLDEVGGHRRVGLYSREHLSGGEVEVSDLGSASGDRGRRQKLGLITRNPPGVVCRSGVRLPRKQAGHVDIKGALRGVLLGPRRVVRVGCSRGEDYDRKYEPAVRPNWAQAD